VLPAEEPMRLLPWRAVVLVRLAFVEVYIIETRTKEKAGDRSPALSAVGVRY